MHGEAHQGQTESVYTRHANHGDPVTPAHPAGGKPGRGPCPPGGAGLTWRTTRQAS